MSLTYKKIRNNTENSIIVNGTYIGPLSDTTMNSDIIDLIDKQYFTAGILTDLGITDIGNSNIVIDTNTIQFYKKPVLGIPKKHLDQEVRTNLEKAARSLQKGQVNLDDLSSTLQKIVQSSSEDVNGDGINDKMSPNYSIGPGSLVIKEKQLEKAVKDSLSLAKTAYQKPEEGILITDLSSDVRYALENKTGDYEDIPWKDPVQVKEDLPFDNNNDGDVRIVLLPLSMYIWEERNNQWTLFNFSSNSDDSPNENVVGLNPLISKTVVCELFANDGQTMFIIENPYDPGTNQLELYLNGILVLKNIDYTEIDNYTIKFLYPLQEDDYVLASINSGYSGAVHNVENVLISNQSDKRVIRSVHAFNPNGEALRVFLNGMMVECGTDRDYIEVDQNHIKFNYDLIEEDRLTLRVGNSNPNENILNQFAIFRKIYSTLSKQVDLIQDKVDQINI